MAVTMVQMAKQLAADTRGGVAVVVAVSLPVVLGFGALGLEYGSAIVTKSHNQRTSDTAAFAAAFAYNRKISDIAEENVAAATISAESVAALNGVSSGVSVSFDAIEGATYVDVAITEEKPVYLSRLLRPNDTLTVNTSSRVTLGDSGFTPCVLSLGEFEHEDLTVNGNSGTYNVKGCGIAANAGFVANGTSIDTSCAAPSFNKNDACTDQAIQSGFADPLADITNWPNNLANDAVCDHTGSLTGDLSVSSDGKNYELLPGVLCVDDMSTSFDSVFSDPTGNGNTLIVKAGVDLKMSGGKQSFSVKPSTGGDFAGVALYAPGSDITTSGNASFSIDGFSCLGLVVNSMTFNGAVALNAECNEDDINFDAYGNGRPQLIR